MDPLRSHTCQHSFSKDSRLAPFPKNAPIVCVCGRHCLVYTCIKYIHSLAVVVVVVAVVVVVVVVVCWWRDGGCSPGGG